MAHAFFTFWEQHYGAIPPLNWKLKGLLSQRWLRIHTLPNSKRYAETGSEIAEIADRQVAAATAVFDQGAPVWLVTWRYRPSIAAGPLETLEPTAIPLVEAGNLVDEEDDPTIVVLVARLRWTAAASVDLRRAMIPPLQN